MTPDQLKSLYALLRLSGHEVHEALDVHEAIDLALELRPDVLLLGIGLPILDGYAAQEPALSGMKMIAVSRWGLRQIAGASDLST
jgi:DNA-binding response OmpR family regulator